MQQNSGIYKWTNKVNGKYYIGQSKDLEKRYKQFLYFPKHYGGKIIGDVRKKYNDKSYWDYEVLEYCPIEKMNEREIYYIKLFDSTNRDKGYNNTIGGDGCIGYVFTEEAKKAVSEGLKDKHYRWTEEEKKRFGENQRGDKNPMWGRRYSEEEKKIMSERMKGSKNPFYGKTHSKETLERITSKTSKPIYQIDAETNEIIREWKSACVASRELNICRKGINNCCNNNQLTSGGYKWSFINKKNN